ncbi:MAG: ATP-dependent DNA helicase RecG [Bacillota bacterium]
MEEQQEIMDKILQPIDVEEKLGYNNSSVFGGFADYLCKWLNKLINLSTDQEIIKLSQELIEIFSEYTALPPKERAKKVEDSRPLFNQLAELVAAVEDNQRLELPQIWLKSIRYVNGVGEKRAKKLAKLGINNLRDMLFYLPRDYRDWSQNLPIGELTPGSKVTVSGQVLTCKDIRPNKKLTITKVIIGDQTGSLSGVWFNQPYIKQKFEVGSEVAFSGEVKKEYGELQITHPHYELLEKGQEEQLGKILPIYSTTEGLSQTMLRKIIQQILAEHLDQYPELLSDDFKMKHNLFDIEQALKKIHFPKQIEETEEARRRLAFDELFILQLGILLQKSELGGQEEGIVHDGDDQLIADYLADLPFELTTAQSKVWREIKGDLEAKRVMNRLVQGDVGSGKTVVATLALLKAVSSGYQGAMMAPTEILAEQHYLGLKESLAKYDIEVGLLVGSLSAKEKEVVLEELQDQQIDILIGTHALIQEQTEFANLGLVITDEQHRFGVRQRASLQSKGQNPDVLVMTATPIPRSLALTLYGELDLSVIDELPPGRKPVVTEWRKEESLPRIYSFLEQELRAGRQAYVVCPLVDESEEMDLRSAEKVAEKLDQDILAEFEVGLLHGQLNTEEKERVMEEFRSQELDLLVSTTVIEVGVDVANATVMLILDAQRFGLAQLHQLRGRVGRSNRQSYCVLVADPNTDSGRERMRIMTESTDGFVIAEEDLKLRGPGEFFGTRQHGLPDLEAANLVQDNDLLEIARQKAAEIIDSDPQLELKQHHLLSDLLDLKFAGELVM